MPQVLNQLVVTSLQAVPGATCRGFFTGAVLPTPSWAKLFRPQHHRVPSVLMPQVVAPLVLIDCHPVSATATGTALPFVVPLPSWPNWLAPQQVAPPQTLSTTWPEWPVVTGVVPETV